MSPQASDRFASMADAWNAGDFERVVELAAPVDASDAGFEYAQALLGLAQMQTHRHAQAVETLAALTRARPDVSAYWNNLGEACRRAGDLTGSERALSTAKSLAPDDAEVHYNLGLLHIQQRRWSLAREALLESVRLSPSVVEARLQAAHACHVCGDIEGEESMLEGAEHWPPQTAEQALVLASILSTLGRMDTALDTLSRARLPDGPASEALRLRIGAQRVALYERNNLIERAREALRHVPLPALESLPIDEKHARIDGWRAHAAMAMREQRYADASALYRRVLDLADDDESRASAAFGLAAALDRQALHGDAWNAIEIAHASQMNIARQAAPELSGREVRPLPMAARSVDASAYAGWESLRAPVAERSPVFVIGFPRSGTTLLEQMLDAHPDFASMDERGFIYQLIERMERAGQRYPADLADLSQADVDQLRAIYFRLVDRALPNLGARRLVDKNPLNMLCLPMILRLFPRSRIILCVRHPCDVLLSCSMQSFRSPAFMAMCSSLDRLARGFADAFEHCCAHLDVFEPRLLEWRYESVLDDFDGAVARLGKFLAVEDASAFSNFAANARARRFISTPSYANVAEPLNRKSIGRWKHYRDRFEPVMPLLRPWMKRFDYTA